MASEFLLEDFLKAEKSSYKASLLTICFSNVSQLKIVNIPKGHILGWYILLTFTCKIIIPKNYRVLNAILSQSGFYQYTFPMTIIRFLIIPNLPKKGNCHISLFVAKLVSVKFYVIGISFTISQITNEVKKIFSCLFTIFLLFQMTSSILYLFLTLLVSLFLFIHRNSLYAYWN